MNDRIDFLREDALREDAPALESEEMRYLYAKGWFDASEEWMLPKRQTAARCAVLRGMTPVINEWELIVGRQNFSVRLTEEQKDFLAMAEKMIPLRAGMDSHMAPDYEKLLREGTEGVREEINRKKAALDTFACPDDIDKEIFYDDCLDALSALETLASHYAAHARALAAGARPVRAAELEKIAENLDRVPRYPARTFYEALQSIQLFTFHLGGLYQMGRPDQYLLPYYKRDIEYGVLTEDGALEMIDCFCLMYNKTVPKGLAVGLMVGGRDQTGAPVENDLTRLFLRSIFDTRLPYPGVGLCVTRDTSDDILRLAARALGKGLTHPALFNDEVIVEGLTRFGLPFEDAVSYTHSTCVEITPVGCSAVWVAAPYHNLMRPLLEIMEQGDMPGTFEELMTEYENRLARGIREEARRQNLLRYNRRIFYSHPLLSCFVNDCLERGRDLDRGGARYAWIEPSFVGMANLTDSLVAVRRLIYEEKCVTPDAYARALRDNFAGWDALLAKIDALPKYGNDEDEPDAMAARIAKWIPCEVAKMRVCGGERMAPSMFCWVMHAEIGKNTGATPDGRRAGFPLGDGSGPAQGREHNGPTASVLSSTCWDHAPFIGGIAVNMKFSQAMFGDESVDKLIALIRVFMARGGFEMQVNAVDRSALEDAKIHPEAHRDLVVRIGGYSDYFTHLSPAMQDEVLLRTEHEA